MRSAEVKRTEEETIGLVTLTPLLWSMNAADEESWTYLHLAVIERGGFTPVEALVLQQVVAGLLPEVLRDNEPT